MRVFQPVVAKHMYGAGAIVFLSVVLCWLIYLPLLPGELFSTDDVDLVTPPFIVAPLSLASLKTIWTPGSAIDFYPIRDLSYVLDWRLSGGTPMGFRIHQLILASVAALFIYILLLQVGVPILNAALMAALWLLHPIHIEMFAWISARKDMLALVFGLAATVFFLRGTKSEIQTQSGSRKSLLQYAFAISFFVLSLLSKASLVGLSSIWLAGAILFIENPFKRKKKYLCGTLALAISISVSYCVLQSWFYSSVNNMRISYPWGDRILASLTALGRAIGGWLYPSANALDWMNWAEWQNLNSSWLVVGCLVWAIAVSTGLLSIQRRQSLGILAVTAFLALYLPISGLLFPHRNFYAVRYFEPLFCLAVLGIGFQIRNRSRRWTLLLLLPLLLVSVVQTIRYIPTWDSNVSVRRNAVRITPLSIPLKTELLTDLLNELRMAHINETDMADLKLEIKTLAAELTTICDTGLHQTPFDSCIEFWRLEKAMGKEGGQSRYLAAVEREGLFSIAMKLRVAEAIVSGNLPDPLIYKQWLTLQKAAPSVEYRLLRWAAICLDGNSSDASEYLTQLQNRVLINKKDAMQFANDAAAANKIRLKTCL